MVSLLRHERSIRPVLRLSSVVATNAGTQNDVTITHLLILKGALEDLFILNSVHFTLELKVGRKRTNIQRA